MWWSKARSIVPNSVDLGCCQVDHIRREVRLAVHARSEDAKIEMTAKAPESQKVEREF